MNMKKITLLFVLIWLSVFLVWCFNTDLGEDTDELIVWNDRDEHWCIGSAGYVWDEKKQECVRPWEEE